MALRGLVLNLDQCVGIRDPKGTSTSKPDSIYGLKTITARHLALMHVSSNHEASICTKIAPVLAQ